MCFSRYREVELAYGDDLFVAVFFHLESIKADINIMKFLLGVIALLIGLAIEATG
ncbi:MAG: hypothetical protein HOO93_00025 [Methyloglobulus sp.]|nr:hypothetical protein [Methyloglobulus sp.]